MKKIVFTGGGSAGHVTPNVALIEKLKAEPQYALYYIGSHKGIEKKIIEQTHIPYFEVSCGKLRRYFSWKSFVEPFKIFWGIVQSFFMLRKIKPQVVFSKGGFVAFPVVVAAWLARIPVIAHESDFTPGLANRLSFPFLKTLCITFPETKKYVPKTVKVVETGTPIREKFFLATREQGLSFCNFTENKKVILVAGGGLGAECINNTIRLLLPKLLESYQVIHLCGPKRINVALKGLTGYKQYEYLHDEMYNVMACADIVVSRSGANALYELIGLKKPHILIPLSKKASRGDQIVNAKYFEKAGISLVIPEEKLTAETLFEAINTIQAQSETYRQAREQYDYKNGVENIYQILVSSCKI
ncbi:MAG: undecaprenyldiphospho-muramoylpentapeptide beta-N-acetylglucosaminyltransferase [Gammaproteobacteria bacterium]